MLLESLVIESVISAVFFGVVYVGIWVSHRFFGVGF